MPALVFDQTIRLRGLRPSLTAAEWTVGYPRQSMKVPKTPPSQRQGRTAAIQASLKARNSASVISPDAMANSRCPPPVTCPAIGTFVRLVGQNEAGGRIAFHQTAQCLRVSRAAADDPVRAEVNATTIHCNPSSVLNWRPRSLGSGVFSLTAVIVLTEPKCQSCHLPGHGGNPHAQ